MSVLHEQPPPYGLGVAASGAGAAMAYSVRTAWRGIRLICRNASFATTLYLQAIDDGERRLLCHKITCGPVT